MKKNFVKRLAVALSLAMTVSTLAPAASADAAAAPAFKSYKTSVYENGTNKGSYTYTVKNIKKGYTVKWSVTGDGKAYVKASKTSTKASKTTASNTIKVATNGAKAAKNAKATVTAKVYNTKNKLVKTIKDAVTVKVQATGVAIKTADGSNFKTSIGAKYDLNRTLTPSNSTSKTYWSVEPSTDATIDSQGVLTATAAGTYTVTATVRNSKTSKVVATATQAVTVADAELASVKQTASNAFTATFTSDASKKVTVDNFAVESADGSAVFRIKSVEFAADGLSAKVTTYNNFLDGVTYNVTCGNVKLPLTAQVGKVARVVIETASAQENVKTPIEFKLYDAADIDVTPSINLDANCVITVSGNHSGADIDKASEASITMNVIGSTAEVTVTYNSHEAGATDIIATQTITCVDAKAVIGGKVFVTTTNTNKKSECAKFYLGLSDQLVRVEEDNSINDVYFCAKEDSTGDVISYDSYAVESSNDEIMNVWIESVTAGATDSGKFTRLKVTGNKIGNAQINITAMKNGKATIYTIPVTVTKINEAVTMPVEVTRPLMSDVNDDDYFGTIIPKLLDANGNEVAGTFTFELTTITDTSITGRDQLQLVQEAAGATTQRYTTANAAAKTYTIKVTGADNRTGKKIVRNVDVTVRALPVAALPAGVSGATTTGTGIAVTYQVELSPDKIHVGQRSFDIETFDAKAVTDTKSVYAALYATYNGLFAGYVRGVTAGAITIANGNVIPSATTELNNVQLVARFGNLLFQSGAQTNGLLGSNPADARTAYAATQEQLPQSGPANTTTPCNYNDPWMEYDYVREDTSDPDTIIAYGEVGVNANKTFREVGRSGSYVVEYDLTYQKDVDAANAAVPAKTAKPIRKTESFTIVDKVVLPTVSTVSATSKNIKGSTLQDVVEALKTNVDMNNNVSEHESIVNAVNENAVFPTVATKDSKLPIKYAVVTDDYGALTWNFWVPINMTFIVN